MNAFDRIIGCSREKRELSNICDALKNPEVYEKLGAKIPGGLLIFGKPGIGKTLMANALMEELGRTIVALGSHRPQEDFAAALEAASGEAVRCAPSVLFIDNLELYVDEEFHCENPASSDALQKCIDGLQDKNVFVLAVMNREEPAPDLFRVNLRIGRYLEVNAPEGKEAVEVVARVLQERGLEKLDPEAVTKILEGFSAEDLDAVLDEAGFLAACDRSPDITMEHFLRACLSVIYGVDDDAGPGCDEPDARLECIARHEAGHAVVREVLCPGAVSFLYAGKERGREDCWNDGSGTPLYRAKSNIAALLGGMAAEELACGRFGAGCADGKRDVEDAFQAARSLVCERCIRGFGLHSMGEKASGQLLSAQEKAVAAEVEEGYRKAREILTANGEFFKKLVAALVEKRVLSSLDVARIRSGCTIAPAEM